MSKIKPEIITIPEKISVFEDKKTLVKTVAFPFTFPNGRNGIISVTHLDPRAWLPSRDINNITINFVDYDN